MEQYAKVHLRDGNGRKSPRDSADNRSSAGHGNIFRVQGAITDLDPPQATIGIGIGRKFMSQEKIEATRPVGELPEKEILVSAHARDRRPDYTDSFLMR